MAIGAAIGAALGTTAAAGTTIAVVAGTSLIGTASSMFQAEQQKSAAKKDAEKRDKAATREKEKLAQIASDTTPEGERATGIEFGSGDGEIGSTSDFLVPRSNSLGASGGSGLGNSGRAGLGFKV